MNLYIIGFFLGFGVSLIFVPIVFMFTKKLGMNQKILFYVKEHYKKEGTPTMGGIIFLSGLVFASLFLFKKDSTLALVSLAATISFGLLGFLDDFIKVKFKQNLGLKAYQKIVGQIGISAILALFAYRYVGSQIILPFVLTKIDLGVFFVPFVMFVYIAVVNSVNLIDGLDGLSTGVSSVFIFAILLFMLMFFSAIFPSDKIVEGQNLILICCIMLGALLVFFLINCYPAQIFMGDTGSLAIGGFITSISVFSSLSLLIPIFGIMYVVTALSDVIQVGYYKIKKKRIFKMAPLHHHFQMSGMNENKIVVIYIVISILVSLLNFLLTNVFYFGEL